MGKTIGYTLFLLCCLCFGLILVVPWLDFTTGQKAGITTGLIIAGEVFFYVSLIFLGKPFLARMKGMLKLQKTKSADTTVPADSKQQ
jgi:hypothetical protein